MTQTTSIRRGKTRENADSKRAHQKKLLNIVKNQKLYKHLDFGGGMFFIESVNQFIPIERKTFLRIGLSSVALVCSSISFSASAQTSVRDEARDQSEAQDQRSEAALERAKTYSDSAAYAEDGAYILEGVGTAVSAVWDLPAAPFEVLASGASWSAGKQRASSTLAAAEYFDQFRAVSDTDLDVSKVRDVLRQNPEFANLGNTALIGLVHQELVFARADAEAFRRRVESAQEEAGIFSDQVLDDLMEIQLDQSGLSNQIDDIEEAIALRNRQMLESTEQLLVQGNELLEIQSRQARRYAERFDQVQSDIAQVVRQGGDVSRAVNEDIRVSRVNQGLLVGNRALLTGLDRRTRSIEGGVNFVAIQTFHGLSPKDQINILRNSEHPVTQALFGASPPPQNVQATTARAQAIAKQLDDSRSRQLRQEIVSNVQTTMGVLNGIDQVGQSLGWEFTQDKKYRDGMKILNVAAGLGVAYMTGNPMLAVNTLTSAFASPDNAPSAGESMILNQLGIMDRKLDLLLEGQQDILTSIRSSTEEINRIQYETLYRLDAVDEQFDQLRTTASATLSSISGYSDFFQQRSECVFVENDIFGEFSGRINYSEMTARLAIRPESALGCARALGSVWKPSGIRDTALHPHVQLMSSVVTDQNGAYRANVLQFNDLQFSPLLRMLWRSFEVRFGGQQNPIGDLPFQLISSLSEPTASLDLVRNKASETNQRTVSLLSLTDGEISRSGLILQFANLLAPDSLIEMSDYYITMAPLLDARTGDSSEFRIFSQEEISKQGPANLRVVENQLRVIHHLLNMAIAQQSLLSGDLLIPYIADFILQNEHSELRNDVLFAMEANPTLSMNVLTYLLDREISYNRTLPSRESEEGTALPASSNVEGFVGNWANNLEAYDSLFSTAPSLADGDCDAERLTWRCFFSDEVQIDGRELVLNTTRLDPSGEIENDRSIRFMLPSPRALQDRKLSVRSNVVELAQARQRLLQFIDGYITQAETGDVGEVWALQKGFLVNFDDGLREQ